MPASIPTTRELTSMLTAIGWKLDKLDAPNKTTGRFVAKGTGPAGQKGERDGDTPERALSNLLVFAQHHNAIRSYASLAQKFAYWQTPWVNQLDEIGHAYGQLPVYDPKSVPAWHALANESAMQADAIRRQLNVHVTDDPEPYPHHAAMLDDIHKNQNFVVSRAHSDHPVWTPNDNVNFRIVHDVLGHGQSGGDFGWEGENRACGIHFPMVSPLARRALFTECIGQTGYALRKGSHGFGPQKVAMMPEFLDPVEKMNGEHVHVPSGKLIYPENIMPVEGAGAWGWYQDPETGKWTQDTSAPDTSEGNFNQNGGQLTAKKRKKLPVQTSATLETPGASQYQPPHHQTPLEYPDRPAYSSIEPSISYPDILPQTPIDPNMYAHSSDISPLVQQGSQDDYLNRPAVEQNIQHYDNADSKWYSESPAIQLKAIRNALMVSILSPKKPLLWNAAHYQAMQHLGPETPLGDYFQSYLEAKDKHNEALGHEPIVYGQPYTMTSNWRDDLKIIQKNLVAAGVSDAEGWKQSKEYLWKLFQHFEPYAESMLRKENEMRKLNQQWSDQGPIDRPKKQKAIPSNDLRLHLITADMVADFLHQNVPLPGKAYRNKNGEVKGLPKNWVPGATLDEQPLQLSEIDQKLPNSESSVKQSDQGGHKSESRYMGAMYGQMERISELTPELLEQLRQYAQKDIQEDNGRGFIWRAGCTALHVPGIDQKTASFAWLLLMPHNSELGIIDTHAARAMGFKDSEVNGNGGHNYYAMERMQRAIKDSSGYSDMPQGKFHWGMWDMVKHPGQVSDHSALRPLDAHPWDDPEYPWPPEPEDAKTMPVYHGHSKYMQALAGAGRSAMDNYLSELGLKSPESRNLTGEVSQDDPNAFGEAGPDPTLKAASFSLESLTQPLAKESREWGEPEPLWYPPHQPQPQTEWDDFHDEVVCPHCKSANYGGKTECTRCGKPLSVTAGWRDKVKVSVDAEGMPKIDVAKIMQEAHGNPMAAQQLIKHELIQAGYSNFAAWQAADQLIQNYRLQTPPENEHELTDMSGFEDAMQQPDESGSDWGPTAEHPEDFNPNNVDWEPSADQSHFNPEMIDGKEEFGEPTGPPAFKAGDRVHVRNDPQKAGTILEAEPFEGDYMYRVKMDDGQTVNGGGEAFVQVQGMQFPEPTGQTIPNDLSGWSESQQDYYRNASQNQE